MSWNLKRIDDVDTTQVGDASAGWTTPPGGGLHLVTDYRHDQLGRPTEELGPWHTIDIGGTSTAVRRATWYVHDDLAHEVRTGQGYATGTAPDYTYTLVNPVTISKRDLNNNLREEIRAVRSDTSGKLQPTDSFPQSSYVRWTTHQYIDCCLLASTRVYHTIPASGEGAPGENYEQTSFGYDSAKRRNRAVSPGGTIRFDVLDVRAQVTARYEGTDDSGATETDPTGGGADPNNNMVLVTANQYDGSQAGGDGNLTRQTQHVSDSETRVTDFTYDWRNRRTATDGEMDFYEQVTYDNLDRAIETERYDTTSSGNLVSRQETLIDDRGRLYRTIRWAVDVSTGSVGNALVDDFWFDAAGNQIKSQPAGSKLFTKTVHDGVGRQTAQYAGYDLDESTYAQAASIDDDTILQQTETHHDAASNVIQVAQRQRHHNAPASQTGTLGDPSTDPKARVTYTAHWHDAIGRGIATAAYGTNGGTALVRPDTIPERSDTVLVTTIGYNDAGEAFQTIDPSGREDCTAFDHAGRRVELIENYVDGNPATGGADQDCTTQWTYAPDGAIATITAVNADTGDQVTTYVQGTTLADSDVARSDLLRRVLYPDSSGESDSVEHRYNRQGERRETKDQRGTVHAFDFDKLGRQVHDRVVTLGAGVDGAVRRISTTYEVRGLVEHITSWDDATVGQGNIVNDVSFGYNAFGQPTNNWQAHSGAVDVNTTPKVGYTYADGSQNTIRPTGLIYPDEREITFDYGAADGIDDAASRVVSLVDSDAGSTHLVDYAYLGLATFVAADYTEPEIQWTLIDLTGSDDPDTGDIYSGLDRFGRVKDNRWYDYDEEQDADRIRYGYDRASSRIWRENVVAASMDKELDELYQYDGLHRLIDMQRGRLTAGKDAIETSTVAFAQQWQLDETGNWPNFKEDEDGDQTWNLQQDRTHNPVNEITDITNTVGPPWVTPAYDAAGNMTTIPKPAVPGEPLTATYDAWNRLVKIEEPDGQGGLRTLQKNAYDGRNFRIVREDFSNGSLAATCHLYYTNQWQVIEQRQGATPDIAPAERQFIWGQRYSDELILRDRDTTADATLDERLYALQDANWNVTTLVPLTGHPLERYVYSAYGVLTIYDPTWATLRSVSSYDIEYTYSGRRLDGETGLYYYRNRYYHAAIGRFLGRDLIGYNGSHWNLYEYASSRPVNAVDPSGMRCTLLPGWPMVREESVTATAGGLELEVGLSSGAISAQRTVTATYECCYGWGPWRQRRVETRTFENEQSLEVPISRQVVIRGPSLPIPTPGRIGPSLTWYSLHGGEHEQALADRDCKDEAPFTNPYPTPPLTTR